MYTFPDGTLRSCAARYGMRSVWTNMYTAVYGTCTRPCTWHDTAVCTRPTAVTCRLGPCTRPCRPTWHVHVCVLAVYTDVYMARSRPFNCGVDVCTCNGRITVVPYTRPVHGRVCHVVMYTTRVHDCVRAVCTDVFGRVRGAYTVPYTGRAHGRVHDTYTVALHVSTCTRAV